MKNQKAETPHERLTREEQEYEDALWLAQKTAHAQGKKIPLTIHTLKNSAGSGGKRLLPAAGGNLTENASNNLLEAQISPQSSEMIQKRARERARSAERSEATIASDQRAPSTPVGVGKKWKQSELMFP